MSSALWYCRVQHTGVMHISVVFFGRYGHIQIQIQIHTGLCHLDPFYQLVPTSGRKIKDPFTISQHHSWLFPCWFRSQFPNTSCLVESFHQLMSFLYKVFSDTWEVKTCLTRSDLSYVTTNPLSLCSNKAKHWNTETNHEQENHEPSVAMQQQGLEIKASSSKTLCKLIWPCSTKTKYSLNQTKGSGLGMYPGLGMAWTRHAPWTRHVLALMPHLCFAQTGCSSA